MVRIHALICLSILVVPCNSAYPVKMLTPWSTFPLAAIPRLQIKNQSYRACAHFAAFRGLSRPLLANRSMGGAERLFIVTIVPLSGLLLLGLILHDRGYFDRCAEPSPSPPAAGTSNEDQSSSRSASSRQSKLSEAATAQAAMKPKMQDADTKIAKPMATTPSQGSTLAAAQTTAPSAISKSTMSTLRTTLAIATSVLLIVVLAAYAAAQFGLLPQSLVERLGLAVSPGQSMPGSTAPHSDSGAAEEGGGLGSALRLSPLGRFLPNNQVQ